MNIFAKLRSFMVVAVGVAGLCTTAWGQTDLTGDGRPEVVLGEPGSNEIVVYSGTTGAELWRASGSNWFGWAATAHPDVNGDGLADVIVAAPGGGVGTPGLVQALRGTDGKVLWSRQYGAASAKFGIGMGVIPDQNSDGVADILVAMLSDDPSGETGVLLSGKTGLVLATAPGPVATLLETTRNGTFKFKTKDLNQSGTVDVFDALLVAQAIVTNDTYADLDFSGSVDGMDLIEVIDEILVPPPTAMTPEQFIGLSLSDPLKYNDGYQLIPLTNGYEAGPPFIYWFDPNAPVDPCKALYDAMRQAALDWARHLRRIPWPSLNPVYDWYLYKDWREESDRLYRNYLNAMGVLNTCLIGSGRSPLKHPTDVLPPMPATPPPP